MLFFKTNPVHLFTIRLNVSISCNISGVGRNCCFTDFTAVIVSGNRDPETNPVYIRQQIPKGEELSRQPANQMNLSFISFI